MHRWRADRAGRATRSGFASPPRAPRRPSRSALPGGLCVGDGDIGTGRGQSPGNGPTEVSGATGDRRSLPHEIQRHSPRRSFSSRHTVRKVARGAPGGAAKLVCSPPPWDSPPTRSTIALPSSPAPARASDAPSPSSWPRWARTSSPAVVGPMPSRPSPTPFAPTGAAVQPKLDRAQAQPPGFGTVNDPVAWDLAEGKVKCGYPWSASFALEDPALTAHSDPPLGAPVRCCRS